MWTACTSVQAWTRHRFTERIRSYKIFSSHKVHEIDSCVFSGELQLVEATQSLALRQSFCQNETAIVHRHLMTFRHICYRHLYQLSSTEP